MDAELARQAQARTEAIERILESTSPKRLIVAGPGTGKTSAFGRAFARVGDAGLALTFIRALVKDLKRALPETVQVNTFHGYCVHLLRRFQGSEPFMYPPLFELVAEDLRLKGRGVDQAVLDQTFHELDDTGGLITETIARADYYGSVSHNDIVYRVLRTLQARPNQIETFPLVVVDEFQDFSRMETEFIAVLATRNHVLIAGDDDQALYDFKHASPKYLRGLAADASFARFELPFCSRCTRVVVWAIVDVIDEATRRGHLKGRLTKPFACYLPDKAKDNDAHPRIVVARCSVELKAAPYMGRYVVQEIARIHEDDIRASHAEGYPTVLVLGRKPFLDAVYRTVHDAYPQAVPSLGARLEADPLEGYRRLLVDERSRIGWRILVATYPFAGGDEVVARTLGEREELVDLVPADYRHKHLEITKILRRVVERATIDASDQQQLERALARPIKDIRRVAAPVVDDSNETPEVGESELSAERGRPSIICTSLIGAKGLSAGYVFVVGFVNGSIPENPGSIHDDEVCCVVVALSRTRKECHLVTCRLFGGTWYDPSTFLDWIHQPKDERRVDKNYWKLSAPHITST